MRFLAVSTVALVVGSTALAFDFDQFRATFDELYPQVAADWKKNKVEPAVKYYEDVVVDKTHQTQQHITEWVEKLKDAFVYKDVEKKMKDKMDQLEEKIETIIEQWKGKEGTYNLCVKACNKNHIEPLCGSDGKNYRNECAMEMEACLTGVPVTMLYPGICKENMELEGGNQEMAKQCRKACPRNYDPICGSDGKTHSNKCTMEVASCMSSTPIYFVRRGTCEAGMETKEEEKGNNGALTDSWEPEEEVELDKEFIDKHGCYKMCTLEWNPICGSDGQTYANQCNLAVSICRNKDLYALHEGVCDLFEMLPTREQQDLKPIPDFFEEENDRIQDPIDDEDIMSQNRRKVKCMRLSKAMIIIVLFSSIVGILALSRLVLSRFFYAIHAPPTAIVREMPSDEEYGVCSEVVVEETKATKTKDGYMSLPNDKECNV